MDTEMRTQTLNILGFLFGIFAGMPQDLRARNYKPELR